MIIQAELKCKQTGCEADPCAVDNINFYGIVILLRKLRECGIFTEKELRKIAARISADNGVEVMFFL